MKVFTIWMVYALVLCLVTIPAFPLVSEQPDAFFINLATQHNQNVQHRKRVNLIRFFNHYRGATPYPITAYINASKENQIDYRLLPSISLQESSAGRHACGNNWWGWQSCRGYNFGSVNKGVEYVSSQLANGHYYRGKPTNQLLRTYNPNPEYAGKVERFMKEISNE